jgi:hypothetical protein
MKTMTKIGVGILAMAVASVATADIDYNGLVGAAKVPDGFQGMNSSADHYYFDAATSQGVGGGYAEMWAYSGGGDDNGIGFTAFEGYPLEFWSPDGSKFDIYTVDAASAWKDWVEVRFVGLNDGDVIYDTLVRLSESATYNLNYLGIDHMQVHYFRDSGSNRYTNGDGVHTVFDNWTMIPTPGSLALLGLGGLAFSGRRRRA